MSQNGNPKKVKIHYVKTSSYRSYYADGFFGGITPTGKLYVEPFIDKGPVTKSIDFSIKNDKLGSELSRETIEGYIREIEAGLVFDLSTAESLIAWLQQKVRDIKQK